MRTPLHALLPCIAGAVPAFAQVDSAGCTCGQANGQIELDGTDRSRSDSPALQFRLGSPWR